jgi:hypothetical protein
MKGDDENHENHENYENHENQTKEKYKVIFVLG